MPIDPASLLIFIPAALALNLTPGADMLFCLGQGLKGGPRAGIAASLGIATGAMGHVLIAGVGLAAVLAAYPLAFEAIRWAGVAYLLYLAVETVRRPAPAARPSASTGPTGAWQAYRSAIWVNLLNPKVAIFVLAFVPQFVDPVRGSTLAQFLILGFLLNIGGTAINATVGGGAGSIGRALTRNGSAMAVFRWATGGLFVGLAVRLALDAKSA